MSANPLTIQTDSKSFGNLGTVSNNQNGNLRAEPNILKNSWRLRSDQDGGSGGHRSGQRRVQVREQATGDLLVFVFVNKIPLELSLFLCESKSFFDHFLCHFV